MSQHYYEPMLKISETYLAAWANMSIPQLHEVKSALLERLDAVPQSSSSVILGYRETLEQLEYYIEARKAREDDKNNRTR